MSGKTDENSCISIEYIECEHLTDYGVKLLIE